MKKITIITILASILAIGCSKQQNVPNTNNKPLMVRLGTVNQIGDSTFYNIKVIG